MRSQSSSPSFWKLVSRRMPALLTTMSTRPHVSSAHWTILPPSSTESKLAMASPPAALISSTTFCAGVLLCPPPCMEPPRSLTTTRAPRLPRRRAWERPRPPPAPVTIATRPSKRRSLAMGLTSWRRGRARSDLSRAKYPRRWATSRGAQGSVAPLARRHVPQRAHHQRTHHRERDRHPRPRTPVPPVEHPSHADADEGRAREILDAVEEPR